MKQFKIAISVLGATLCFGTLIIYYWRRSSILNRHQPYWKNDMKIKTSTVKSDVFEESFIQGTPMRHKPLNEIYKDHGIERGSIEDDDSFEMHDVVKKSMIDTPGCEIPTFKVNYEKNIKKQKILKTCGRRAVFLKKWNTDKVHATIKANIMKKYLRKSPNFDCCYRFISRKPDQYGHENKKIKFSACNKLHNGGTITLETDFINIRCFEYDKRNVSHIIYDDVFAFAKKINASSSNETTCKSKYNVLMLGMDSMSLPRFVMLMPRTIAFFKDNFWLGYRGYNKVGDNTFPNLMAALTGHNLTTLSDKCSGKMDQCNDLLIWSRFKKQGYVTAYGEDYLRLPDTFNNDYTFLKPPTDHYMRPLFMKGETELNNKSLVCAGKVPSGRQILDYALDFALTYRRNSFFGLFWMNSYSHNINSRPQDADKMFENFFNQLTYTGALYNTFVIFFSDHGIRFGDHRLKAESYFDERMPFLFMWAPTLFKERHSVMFNAAATNLDRLITPYDVYNTLVDINRMADCSILHGSASEACPNCRSILRLISNNRTCEDVAIHGKWCSCHRLYPLDDEDTEGMKSIVFVVSHIKSMMKSVKTKKCWVCMSLTLKKVIRIHFYYDRHKMNLYHVIAFTMNPGSVSYEATVLVKNKQLELVGSVSVISPYRGLGKCTMQPKDRLFCVCQKIENCRLNS